MKQPNIKRGRIVRVKCPDCLFKWGKELMGEINKFRCPECHCLIKYTSTTGKTEVVGKGDRENIY